MVRFQRCICAFLLHICLINGYTRRYPTESTQERIDVGAEGESEERNESKHALDQNEDQRNSKGTKGTKQEEDDESSALTITNSVKLNREKGEKFSVHTETESIINAKMQNIENTKKEENTTVYAPYDGPASNSLWSFLVSWWLWFWDLKIMGLAFLITLFCVGPVFMKEVMRQVPVLRTGLLSSPVRGGSPMRLSVLSSPEERVNFFGTRRGTTHDEVGALGGGSSPPRRSSPIRVLAASILRNNFSSPH